MLRSHKLRISVILIIVCCFFMTVMFGCNTDVDGGDSNTPFNSSVSVANSENGSAQENGSVSDPTSVTQSDNDSASASSAAFSGNAPGKPKQEDTYSAH